MRVPFLLGFLVTLPISAGAQEVQFNRDIRPILSNKCFSCHGPDEKTRKAKLRLDTREGALADLGGTAAIVPGNLEDSEILYRVAHDDPDEIMPPPKSKLGKLTSEEVNLVKRWIAQGAPYQGHWSFEALANLAPPTSKEHPVDAFLNARLKKEQVTPSPHADAGTLLRRLNLDLTGLLPTPKELDEFQTAFAKNPEAAWTGAVDRLLASKHYGERWGRHWLDQARYADSHGYSIDGNRDMWPFRDWVIKALNDDMPFDQFTIEQLAGDLLPNAGKSQLIASAFHRNTLINQEGGSDREQFRNESVIDRVNTTAAVWLGLTVGCAQCHTHKFDPITHREYYQLFAFFNNTEDANNTGPTVEVAEYEVLGNAPKPPEAPKEHPNSGPAKWNPVRYQKHQSKSGAPLHVQKQSNSLLIDPKATAQDTHEVSMVTYLDKVAALRLRVLPHRSLPKNGPGNAGNGNFVLTQVRITLDGKPLKIARAFADHEQPGYPIAHALDRNPETGWAINSGKGQSAKMNAPHEAVFLLENAVAPGGKAIEIHLEHTRNENYLVGHFALDVSPTAPPVPKTKQPSAPNPRKGRLMVMRERKDHRPTYILTRGDFTRPDKEAGEVLPGVLSKVRPALPASDKRPSRVDLAKWIVDPANPLTPRVTVNRIWMRYFGRGLVETEEDFGTQGSVPTHPDLLDYLSRRFVEEGWSLKNLHRLIVTSETYRRSSHARPDLAEKDPHNLLLARQSRLRLDAEIIRDAALSASGLLTTKVGGPSVFPPQPAGIYAFTQTRKNWQTSTGPDRFRRTMYTFFYRSAPYPLLSTFDAPDFQTTCTRRVRSNTPLQALTIANDPAFLEIAQGLALRLLTDLPGGSTADRIRHSYRLALARSPSATELKILSDYVAHQTTDFAAEAESARLLTNDALRSLPLPYTQAAAWVGVARAILNTDNFITRE